MTVCDLILKGGTVVDGTGAPSMRADVVVDGDTIQCIGDCSGYQADQVIDVAGEVIAPGFIDVHTHDDWAVRRQGNRASKAFD